MKNTDTDIDRPEVPFEKILLDPGRYFASPSEVARSPDYSYFDRVRILERWREDALRLEESAYEGMNGGERSRLREVELELASLRD